MNPLLTKNESTFIKGVLIALVVLGHNSILSSNFPLLRQLIVPFDVTGFFLITFLYGYNNIDFFSHFKKLIKGILPMWSLVFIVYTLIYFLWSKNIPSVEEVSVAYALGGNATKEVLGFHLFWFYPAFFYFSIFKWISQQTKFAWLIYSLSAVIIIYENYVNGYLAYNKINAVSSGLYFIAFSAFTNAIIRRYYNSIVLMVSYILVIAFAIMVLFFYSILPNFIWAIIPIPSFICLYNISKLRLNDTIRNMFIYLGKYSLYIFIMHQLAFRGTVYLLKLFPFYQNKPINVILGILSYIVAILIPIIVYNAYLKLKDYAFPRKASQIN